ncbi:MAG: FkbM family methyltransferase [Ignavibacterium sp.]|nr:FkbM family methyltransferase [Ignavibacterium sp.]
MYQTAFFQKIRSLIRRAGLNKLFSNLFIRKDYEAYFVRSLLSIINERDIIYDVGANRGFYTKLFLSKAVNGKVFAFEPIPSNYESIKKLKLTEGNLNIFTLALGSSRGKVSMSIGSDDLKATSHINTDKTDDDIEVEIDTIDNFILDNNPTPNVIKIDVEGYELEVLNGMKNTLTDKSLKVVALEIHFELLEKFGYRKAPLQIIDMLKTNNFKIKWVDPSHIIATRDIK